MRKVRTWPGETEDEHAGYVTACRIECANEAASTAGLLLMPDVEDHAEDEDEMGECDACGFPNPASMSQETIASLTSEELATAGRDARANLRALTVSRCTITSSPSWSRSSAETRVVMKRSPTEEDVVRWQGLVDKVDEAKRALAEADERLGALIPTLDGNDGSLDLAQRIGQLLEEARLACQRIEHPVSKHWAGGSLSDPGPSKQSLHWR